MKPEPFTTTVNPLPPALTVKGERLAIEGGEDCPKFVGINKSKNSQLKTKKQGPVIIAVRRIVNPCAESS